MSLKQQRLYRFLRFDICRRRFDGRPFLGEHVPDLRLRCPALPLADVVEAIGEQSRIATALRPHTGMKPRSRLDAAGRRLQHSGQMLRTLPVGQAAVGRRVPVGRQFVAEK